MACGERSTAGRGWAAVLLSLLLTVGGLWRGERPVDAVEHPPGCLPVAQITPSSTTWSPNCWVGYSYDTHGNYTVAVQRILQGYFHYSGSIDGIWGPNTYSAVLGYQQNRPSLANDGIVGGATWLSLYNDNRSTAYLGVVGGYHSYGAGWNTAYVAFRQCPCFEGSYDSPWRVLHRYGGSYPYMSVYGP